MKKQRQASSVKRLGRVGISQYFLDARRYPLDAESRGFTLVEMIVSVGLFAVVMLICVSSLLALVSANRKVHALQSVMNNLNVTLDGMVRAIRMGNSFDASGGCSATDPTRPKDCATGGTMFSFQPYGNPSPLPTIYRYNVATKRLEKSVAGGAFVSVTSPQVSIDSLQFFVVGANRGCAVSPCDVVQPKVVTVIKGTAPVLNSRSSTTFHIQVTAVQRLLDL